MKNLILTLAIVLAGGLVQAQIIPPGYETIHKDSIFDAGERQYHPEMGACLGYDKKHRPSQFEIEEVYNEAKEVLDHYGVDFDSPSFLADDVPIDEWGPESPLTATVIFSGNGQVFRQWMMEDKNKVKYVAELAITKKRVEFSIAKFTGYIDYVRD